MLRLRLGMDVLRLRLYGVGTWIRNWMTALDKPAFGAASRTLL